MVEKRVEQKITEITYQQFGVIANILVRKVNTKLGKNLNKVSGIYCIPRGGMAFALHMSHHLGLPILKTLKEGAIVIEDISDSGQTLLPYRKNGYFIITLFCKKNSLVIPDVYYKQVPESIWISFPWESSKELEK